MNFSAPNLESQRTKTVRRIVKIRGDYNTWVANETIEDYALRFTPRAFGKWSIFYVANTAFGAIAFLLLEAIGGTPQVDMDLLPRGTGFGYIASTHALRFEPAAIAQLLEQGAFHATND